MSTLILDAAKGAVQAGTSTHFMSNSTLMAAPQRMYRRSFEKNGVMVNALTLTGVPIFRSGTFRDSMGDQKTFSTLDMASMVNNFNFLKDNHIFEDVPVRKGHGSFFGDPMDGLIGYMTGLTAQEMTNPIDGLKYTYLLADSDILDAEAQDKIESGLWRNRSSEIGTFVTNDEVPYGPTMTGYAFVDIPAVEGLNGAFSKSKDFSMIIDLKEHAVADSKTTPAVADAPVVDPVVEPDVVVEPVTPNAPPALEATGAPVGASTETVADLFPQPDDLDDVKASDIEITDVVQGAVIPEVKEVEPEPESAPVGEVTELAQGVVFARWSGDHFEIGGKRVSPAAAVALINKYQAANVANFAMEKKNTVTRLARENKILASKVDSYQEYVSGLDQKQFSSWLALQDDAPETSIFQQYTGTGVQVEQVSADTDEFNIARDIVTSLRRQNKSEEIVQASNSYKRAVVLATKLGVDFS